MEKNNSYTIDDIQTLDFISAVRSRIQMYLGSSDMQGVYNGIQEIISNSIDEYYMGHGKVIQIALGKNNHITICDEARGIPFGIREDGTNVLVDIFSKSHTGGKFTDKIYQSVAGLNGIGAKATCLSSEKFQVGVWRDGNYAYAMFEKGILKEYEERKPNKAQEKLTGTQIQFTPDPQVFNLEPIKIEFSELCKMCKKLSYLTKGLTFELTDYSGDKVVQEKYCAKNGLLDLISDNVKKPVHQTPIYFELEEGKNKIEVALQWTKGSENEFVFTNGLHNSEGGTSLTGLRSAITRTINKDFKKSFTGNIARAGLIYAVNATIPNPSFANQTKTKINNPELRSLADKVFTEAWRQFNLKYPQEVEKIKEFLTKEDKAEQAAERARSAIINSTKEIESAAHKKTYDVEKLKDCLKHGSESILLICEGKSASGALQTARPIETVALYAIDGKIINAKTNPIEKVLENDEVKNIIKVIGAGFFEKFNPSKMNFGKIGMAVDADADGYNIACLIMVLFDTLMPGLIENGHLYWLKTPFYEVVQGGQTYYFSMEQEFKEWEIQNKNKKYTLKRNKGLGSLSDKAKKEGIFDNPDSLVKLTMSDIAAARQQLENLMGENVAFRKEFIYNNIDFSKIIG